MLVRACGVLCTGITTPTIHQLTEELAGMNDWYSLGVALLVPVSKIKEIKALSTQKGTARWRIDLLQYWLDSTPTASWNDIITALEKIGHRSLSTKLRFKYTYLPSTTITTGMRGIYVTAQFTTSDRIPSRSTGFEAGQTNQRLENVN